MPDASPTSHRSTDSPAARPHSAGESGAPILLQARNITKRFPGVLALDDVQFTLKAGEVHALVGENGAGKSTLMKILGGIYHPDGGEVLLNGEPVTIHNPLDAQRRGISIIHQELNLMPDLTVAQNIFFAREPRVGPGFFLSDKQMETQTRELLDRLGLDLDPHVKVGKLTVASQQMVEIAKALSFNSKILIMDEPTAALTDREVESLFRVMADFISDETAIVYISHRMEEIKRIASTITVLRDGRYVSTDPANELSIDDIIKRMVGRQVVSDVRPDPFDGTDVVLSVKDLSTEHLLREVSFDLRRGEVLGFAGLVGAGRTEVARALIGADPTTSGKITVNGKEVKISSPEDAVDNSIAYLSEDRKRYGLLLDKTLLENVSLPSLKIWAKPGGIVDDSQGKGATEKYTDSLRVKTPSILQRAKNLSGGNQQKVVLAKWLARDCDILIFDEPTRGIDIGAKDEIYALMRQLTEAGKSIIVISSEIPEILRVSNRIAVMCNGRITGILNNAQASQEAIMTLATAFDTHKTKD